MITEKLSDLLYRLKKNSKIKSINKDIKIFFQQAFQIKKNPAFIGLTLTFLLLPGDNYYLSLKLNPTRQMIRNLSLNLPAPADYPIPTESTPPPYLTAKSAVVVDVASGSILFEKNPDEPLLPASTTKIMTALVALQNFDLQSILEVKLADRSIGQTMDLVRGEKITVENLLYGLLLHSGNDAAYTLAENYPGGYNAFVEEMNILAEKYNLKNTKFRNVSGIDQIGHYSTVSDLTRLATVAMNDPIFVQIVSTNKKTITDVSDKIVHNLVNRNDLLGKVEGMRGIKTGWTDQAGECLVTSTVRGDHEIIVVVLGSVDRFGESQSLIEWAFASHQWLHPN